MSEAPPEGGSQQPNASGGFMSRRIFGIPAVVLLLIVAVLAYLYFRNRSSASSGGATSTAGTGTSTTGDISFQPAAETIDVQGQYGPNTVSGSDTTVSGTGNTTGAGTGTHNPQPTPAPKPSTKVNATQQQTYTVKRGETLAALAKRFGISVDCLADANRYVPGEAGGKTGQVLGTGAGLKTGQKLKIPHPSECSKS